MIKFPSWSAASGSRTLQSRPRFPTLRFATMLINLLAPPPTVAAFSRTRLRNRVFYLTAISPIPEPFCAGLISDLALLPIHV